VATLLAFTKMMGSRAHTLVTRQVAAYFRLFCVLMIAVVTTFHLCGRVEAKVFQVTAIHASVSPDGSEKASLSEMCHFCAVASLPALLDTTPKDNKKGVLVSQPIAFLASFDPDLTAPPPKA